jgi:phosphomannomutase
MLTACGLILKTKKKWVSLRKSNTEPILRIYSEAPLKEQADSLASEIMALL